MNAERIIRTIVDWAKAERTIKAVALVGSHARGTARADSDIDLVLLTTNPQAFRADTTWLNNMGWDAIGARLWKWQDEDNGQLWSRRLWLERVALIGKWHDFRELFWHTRHRLESLA